MRGGEKVAGLLAVVETEELDWPVTNTLKQDGTGHEKEEGCRPTSELFCERRPLLVQSSSVEMVDKSTLEASAILES